VDLTNAGKESPLLQINEYAFFISKKKKTDHSKDHPVFKGL
jgi:hypothetical protein